MKKTIFEQLCPKCQNASLKRQEEINLSVKKHSSVFQIKTSKYKVGPHAIEKAKKFNVDIPQQRKNIENGTMIEVQKGRAKEEFKYIFRWTDDKDKIYHAIFLKTPKESRLINVYDPSYDMSFKWNEAYDTRIYFNSMRTCCILKEDSIKNIRKDYQKHNQPGFYQQFEKEKETIIQKFKNRDNEK